MADFIDDSAEVSDNEGSDDGHSTGDTDSDAEPAPKKSKVLKKVKKEKKDKKKKRRIASSDEDEDEDDDENAEEFKGFIVNDVEEENEADKASEKSKSDVDEDLDEDDMDLINENLHGGEKRGRAIVDDSDEEDDRDAIGKNLFGMGMDDDEPTATRQEVDREPYSDDERSGSESDGSRADDFIEYEKGERRPIRDRHRKGRDRNIPEGALDEARDIFGVEDFNFDEFYDENEEVEGEEEEVYEEDELGEGEEPRKMRKVKRKENKATLLDAMEPSELDRGYLAPLDKKIQLEDRPERFQTRRVPVTEADEEELTNEARWIYFNAFQTKPLTQQDDPSLPCLLDERKSDEEKMAIEEQAPEKIKDALRFIRNHNFEVPFIGFYRKEGLVDVLAINELWKVYKWDHKWCHLQQRRAKLIGLMNRMQAYLEEVSEPHVRPLTQNDIWEAEQAYSQESLADAQGHFHLFYASLLNKMMEWEVTKKRERVEETGEEDPELADMSTKFKQATRKDKYQMCVENGIGEFVSRFGLTARQFAENLDWRRHEVEQDEVDPRVAAEEYISTTFRTVEEVIDGAVFMLAKQISRDPTVRQKIRDYYKPKARINVRPTQKGRETLDDSHPVWKKRYILEKPIMELEQDDYLHYHLLREQGLLDVQLVAERKVDMEIGEGLVDFFIKQQAFYKDLYTEVAEAWNALRDRVVRMAIGDMIIPSLHAEFHTKLLDEAKEFVVRRCSESMYNRLLYAAYKPPRPENEDEDEDEEERDEVRVLGIVYSLERDQVSFGALVDQDGNVVDTIRLPYLMNRRGPQEERQKKEDMDKLSRFLIRHRPHMIAIAGENLQARFVKKDITDVVMQIYTADDIKKNIQVVIHDNDAAKVYMQSKQAEQEHPDYPPNLRQALSLARNIIDPLIEYAHLYNSDEDIFCLPLHPLQNEVNKDELQEAITLELINRVNEVGVDINKCVELPHHSNLLQFVCGLGPRKAAYLSKIIRQNNNILESRTRLVTLCKMGPKVFMNCAGFLRIDTVKIGERTEAYVEVLDGSRVHPETYEWARKMAVDALEVDDGADPTAALEEVLSSPERLKDLDLDAFAEELQRQRFGDKRTTLYDIRSELFCRYKDLRHEFKELTDSELFGLLTKETTHSLFEGKLVTGKVERIVYKRPQERPQPVRNDRTGLWQCPNCFKKAEDMMYEHCESNDPAVACPGTAIGVRVRLDNGITGFIRNSNLSDRPDSFRSPAERVKIGQPIYCRILKVDPERFSCDLTCKSSDMKKPSDEWGEERDKHWDYDAEKEDKMKDEEAQEKKKQSSSQFIKRVISHPHFHNVTYKDAERMLSKMEQGDAIIRPSSKSATNLTVTWKVADGIFQHIDIQEYDKEKPFTLGKKLMIGTEEFEDLEEILSRFIQPMAACARECLQHKYAQEGLTSEKKDELESFLQDEKRINPSRIPYCFTPSAAYPGKFTLNYLVRHLRQEYITVTVDGFRFRQQIFSSLDQLLTWFKAHFRERPPGGPGGYR